MQSLERKGLKIPLSKLKGIPTSILVCQCKPSDGFIYTWGKSILYDIAVDVHLQKHMANFPLFISKRSIIDPVICNLGGSQANKSVHKANNREHSVHPAEVETGSHHNEQVFALSSCDFLNQTTVNCMQVIWKEVNYSTATWRESLLNRSEIGKIIPNLKRRPKTKSNPFPLFIVPSSQSSKAWKEIIRFFLSPLFCILQDTQRWGEGHGFLPKVQTQKLGGVRGLYFQTQMMLN